MFCAPARDILWSYIMPRSLAIDAVLISRLDLALARGIYLLMRTRFCGGLPLASSLCRVRMFGVSPFHQAAELLVIRLSAMFVTGVFSSVQGRLLVQYYLATLYLVPLTVKIRFVRFLH